MATLTAAQQAKMTPAQIAAWNQRANAYTASQAGAVVKPPAPTNTQTPIPTKPLQIAPAPAPATGGNAPVQTTPANPFNPLAPPTVQPPNPVSTPTTGGNAPVSSASVITGQPPAPQSPPPPTTTPPSMGGNAPVQTLPATPFPATPTAPVQAYPAGMDAGSIVQDFTNGLLDEEGLYMQNARRRGVESAQNRGLRNSTIAGSASQRAAVEAAQPFVQQMVGIQQDRENRAFTGEQNQLDRNQQITISQVTNWLNDQSFQREFNGALSMLPITSSANLMQTIQQYALENPEVYTPDVINGFANFFQNNFATMLQDYFPQYYGGN